MAALKCTSAYMQNLQELKWTKFRMYAELDFFLRSQFCIDQAFMQDLYQLGFGFWVLYGQKEMNLLSAPPDNTTEGAS